MFASKSIRTRLYIAAGAGGLLSACALVGALIQLQAIGTSFQGFIHDDQAMLRAYSEMYAQGLQGGQALRNVVLDPKNNQAYENLSNGNAGFARAMESARKLASYLFGQSVRVIGRGKWRRTQEGEWELEAFDIKQLEALVAPRVIVRK